MKAKLENYTGKVFEKPLDAIYEKCLDCSGNDDKELKLCACTSCSLWPFRFGNTPYKRSRNITEEQRREVGERLKKARQLNGKQER